MIIVPVKNESSLATFSYGIIFLGDTNEKRTK